MQYVNVYRRVGWGMVFSGMNLSMLVEKHMEELGRNADEIPE